MTEVFFSIGLNAHDEEYKMATLKSYLSDNALQLLESFNLPPYQVLGSFSTFGLFFRP